MRIAIDARMMGPLNARGIGRYVEELVRAMLEAGTSHRFVLLTKNPETSPFIGHPSVEHITADVAWYGFAEQVKMPGLFRSAKADLVHVPHWNVPLAFRGPLVITIHDLLLRHLPASVKVATRGPVVSAVKNAGYLLALKNAIQSSRQILVPTQFVADDLARLYPKTSGRITVTSEGLTPFPGPDPDVLSSYQLPGTSYLLYVGSAYPHKRLDVLLAAWKTIAERHPDLSLVIAGQEDVFMARYVAQVKQENLPRVLFTGRVSDAVLAGLLDAALLFVFPSSFEGFGLPPLEALSRGCPVVASDAEAMQEVLPTNGVHFFRNGDADGMIRAIESGLRDEHELKAQAQLASEEVRQRFRWSDVAARTLDAYERAIRS